jgi:hypothetical protein
MKSTKSTKSTNLSPVSITWDGLMLFYFDFFDKEKTYGRCEVKCRDVHDHQLTIMVVKQGRDNAPDSIELVLTHDQLRSFDEFWLHKARDGRPPYAGTARPGDYYNQILAIDESDFYGKEKPLKLKSDTYRPTLYLCDGTVSPNPLYLTENCHRVEDTKGYKEVNGRKHEYSFSKLRYSMADGEWAELKEHFGELEDRSIKGFIKKLSGFARWVNGSIDLKPGEGLLWTGKNRHGSTPQYPLIKDYDPQDHYWIYISYLEDEKDTPKSLEDCKGLGHICESFERDGRPLWPLYSVFAPTSAKRVLKPNAPWNPPPPAGDPKASSDITCCKSCRVSDYE